MTEKLIFGFRWKEINGERMPDCAWIIRFLMHCFWTLAFHFLQMCWMGRRGWRGMVWRIIVERFGWWYGSHRQ